MTIHVLRDYAAASAGYSTAGGVSYLNTPWVYNLSVFCAKILGYSVVGQTAWDINNNNVQTFSNIATIAIAAGSNGQALPQSTIFVTTTTGFPNSGYIYVSTNTGTQIVQYSGITVNAFLNCTGGTGTMTAGQATTIASGSNNVALPTGTINVASTAGFPTSGTIYVITTAGIQTVAYTNTSGGTQFTGCTGGTGTMNTNNAVTSAGGAVACSPIKVINATGTGSTNIPLTITTNLPHGLTNGQYVTIANTTSIVPNGVWVASVINSTQFVMVGNVAGATTFNTNTTANVYNPGMLVASGTGATINPTGASSVYAVSIPPNVRTVQSGNAPLSGDVGRILVLKSSSYPTKNSGLFKISAVNTGNSTTIASGSNNQTLPQTTINVVSTTGFPTSGSLFIYTSTGVQTVTYTNTSGGTQFTGCTGGTGSMTTGNTVSNFNGYNIDYRSTDTPPTETMSWWLYEIETQVSNYVSFTNNSNVTGVTISATTNTSPIQLTLNNGAATRNDIFTGQKFSISGVTGNTNANGIWTITVQSPSTSTGVFTLNGSVGNGTSAAVGTATRLGYTGGDNLSINSKVILQSPHPAGWQVRIALEPFSNTGLPNTSITIGYGGNANGDWPVGGTHTHLAQFIDTNPINNVSISNSTIGSSATTTAIRTGIIGDDTGQAVFCYARAQAAGNNGIITFGLPDNEPTPLPTNVNRPFTYGSVSTSDYGTIQMRFGTANNFGMTFRDIVPEVCAIAGWANADGVSGTGPQYATNGGDSPFTGTTEVLPWEIWAGIATDPALNLPFNTSNGPPPFSLNQRFMGTAPFIRQGRANFGNFTLSTDSTATSTVSTVSATSPIQVTTTATNALTTGQTVVISGVNGVSQANGTFVITVIDTTHFTLNNTSGTGSYISGGTVLGAAHWLHLQNGIYLQWNGAGGLTP